MDGPVGKVLRREVAGGSTRTEVSAEWKDAPMAGNLSRPGTSVTSRALALLGAFDAGHRRLPLSQLAERAGLPVPTAHRLVAELVEWGALARTPTGEYVVGRRLWSVGLLAPVNTGLRQLASPYLHDLYGATLATVHLAVRDGLQVLYLDRLSGNASVPVVSTVGSRLPMHATGVGKVLLAHAPADVQVEVLARLSRVTPYTVSQPGTLRRQLARVRKDDYATTFEEMSLGACSVAVPIRAEKRVVAALGIVVPDLKRSRAQLVAAMRVAAGGIGRALDEQVVPRDRFH
jgi:DNA-binding IclR family transcriptional regulator